MDVLHVAALRMLNGHISSMRNAKILRLQTEGRKLNVKETWKEAVRGRTQWNRFLPPYVYVLYVVVSTIIVEQRGSTLLVFEACPAESHKVRQLV